MKNKIGLNVKRFSFLIMGFGFASFGHASLLKSLDDCSRSCSEICAEFATAVDDRLATYYESCGGNERSRPSLRVGRIAEEQDREPEEYKCTAVKNESQRISQSGLGVENIDRQVNVDGIGKSLLAALQSTCARCGGNTSYVSSAFTTTYTCTIVACVSSRNGQIVPKTNWQNLIPAKCTSSNSEVRDYRIGS